MAVGDDVRHHLERVLRAAETAVDYTDGAGTVGSGTYRAGTVHRGAEETSPASRPEVVVAVAAPQSTDRQRFVVEKLGELGVDRLVWLRAEHGGHRIPSERKAQAWAVAALEQSRGARLLQIDGQQDLASLASAGPVAVTHPGGGELTSGRDPLVVAVGPEGGFSDRELALDGIEPVGLGGRILRTETAAVVAATLVMRLAGRLISPSGD